MDFYWARQLAARVPLLLETPTEIIIEGQALDKVTLNPTFLRKLDYYDYSNLSPFIMNRFWIRMQQTDQNSGWGTYHRPDADMSSVKRDGGASIVKQVWQSTYDPDYFFIMGQRCRGYILKVDKKTNQVVLGHTMIGTSAPNDGFYDAGQCFYHEDQNNMYFMTQTNYYPQGGWTTESSYISWENWWFYVSKTNFATNGYVSYMNGGVVAQIVYKSSANVFMSFNGFCQSNALFGRHTVSSINLTTGAKTDLLTFDGATYVHFPEPSFARQATGKAANLKDYYVVQGNGITGWYIRRVELNIDGPSATKEDCTLDFTSGAFANADMLCLSSHNRQVATRCFTAIGATKEYMGWVFCEKSSNSAEPIARFNLYLFRIDAALRGKLYACQLFSFNTRVRSLLPMNTNWTQFLVITDSYISVMVLNESLNRFDEVTKISGYFRAIGIDETDRIWTLSMDGKLAYGNAYVPTRVTVKLEKSEYKYVGSAISSYVEVSAYDVLSVRIAAQVNLIINAPGSSVTFTDGSKAKTVTTLTDGELQVGIVINSSTRFDIWANTGV